MKTGFTYRRCEGCWDWRRAQEWQHKLSSTRVSEPHFHTGHERYESHSIPLIHTNRLDAKEKDFSQSLRSFTGRTTPRNSGVRRVNSEKELLVTLAAPQVHPRHAVLPISPPVDYYALSLRRQWDDTPDKSMLLSTVKSREELLSTTASLSTRKFESSGPMRTSELQVTHCANCSYLLTKGFSPRHCCLHVSLRPS